MQIIKPFLLVVLSSFLLVRSYCQSSSNDVWQNWSEIQTLSKKEKKPILINIYTNWCRYCKLMDKKTYGQDSVKQFLTNHFYRFKFNAESRDSIFFMGKMYKYNPLYKVHDLVLYLTRGNLAYPATIIIPSENQPPYYELGALDPQQMELLLKYFANKNFMQHSIKDFARSFSSHW